MTAMILTALTTGLFGGLHCAFMCGPLASASANRKGDAAGYLFGRLVAYALAGSVFGVIGFTVSHGSSDRTVEYLAVGLIAAYAFFKAFRLLVPGKEGLVQIGGAKSTPLSWLKLPKRGLALGLMTGLFPCGLLFVAWGLAAASASPVKGALVMASFWAGTLPGLMGVMWGAHRLKRWFSALPVWVHSVAWVAFGAWMLLQPWLRSPTGGGHCA